VKGNNIIQYFLFYYRFLKNKVLIFLFLSIAVGFFDGVGLALFIPLLDSVNAGQEQSGDLGKLSFITDLITSSGLPLTITVLLYFMVVVFFVKGIVKFVQIYYQSSLRQIFLKKVRYTLLRGLGGLSYTGFLRLDAGTIQNTLTTEVQKLYSSFAYFFQSFQASAILGVYISMAFLANPQFAVFVALGAGVSNLLYRQIYKKTKQASVSLSKRGSDFNGLLIQCVRYFKYLKSTDFFSKYEKKLVTVIDHTEQLNKRIGVYGAITQSAKEPIILLIVVFVIQTQLKWFDVSFSSIMVSLLLFYRALSFLAAVQNNWQTFIQNIGSIHTIQKMMEDLEQFKEKGGDGEFKSLTTGIDVRGLSFNYGDKAVLENLNFEIPRNKTVAFIGESGSGKTTLANIISGLLHGEAGGVYVNDTSLSHVDLSSYRSHIGYISQDPVVFNDTVYNNVTLWDDHTPENQARFERAMRLAHLERFLTDLPEQEQTVLGDSGVLISGGQKQRVSIARELYKKNISVLILDEATSALDSETEKIIQENIENLHGQYTIIVIAHRLSTIKSADCIILLEKGKIASQGDFNELMKVSPQFKRMVQLQEFN
jgi:ABC-type multidrug transport system fused ATPase/permease subunit